MESQICLIQFAFKSDILEARIAFVSAWEEEEEWEEKI
jgi:hypothetical protein